MGTSVASGLMVPFLRPPALAAAILALSCASLVNYATYTGTFHVASAVDIVCVVVAFAVFTACAPAHHMWLSMLTLLTYCFRPHPNFQIVVHASSLVNLALFILLSQQ